MKDADYHLDIDYYPTGNYSTDYFNLKVYSYDSPHAHPIIHCTTRDIQTAAIMIGCLFNEKYSTSNKRYTLQEYEYTSAKKLNTLQILPSHVVARYHVYADNVIIRHVDFMEDRMIITPLFENRWPISISGRTIVVKHIFDDAAVL